MIIHKKINQSLPNIFLFATINIDMLKSKTMTTSVKKADMQVRTTLGEVFQTAKAIDKSPDTPVTLIIDETEGGAKKMAQKGTGAKLKEHLKNRKFLLRGKSEEANALGKDFRENLTF